MLQERQEKRSTLSTLDAKEIFHKISQEHDQLSYPQTLELLSNLSYLIVPFDKTTKEFQQLISRLKLVLSNQSGNVKMHELIEAVTRLNVESVNGLIRSKVQEGNYSRAPADICALLYFFASQHRLAPNQRDVDLFSAVLADLRHMQIDQLQMENLDLLVRAFAHSTEPNFIHSLKNPDNYYKQVEEFMPKLVEQTSKEMLRCNLTDVITMMESFYKLWDKNVFSKNVSLRAVFLNCDMYLREYLSQSKKDITGSQFASMVDMIAKAHTQNLYKFESRIVHRLQQIFLNDNAELYVFGMRDILKLFRGFEQINDYFNREKVISGLVELVLEGRIFEDDAFLEVLEECHKRGLLQEYTDLVVKARAYFQERFQFMERKTIIGFIELFKDLGLIFEDKELISLMKDHVAIGFHSYELGELFQTYKLLSHSFYRDNNTLSLLEDAIKIRAGEATQQVSSKNLRDLIEGLKLHLKVNRRVDQSMRNVLKSGNHLASDKRLYVQYVTYLSDFELSVTDEQLKNQLAIAFQQHASSFTVQDRVHLSLYGKSLLTEEQLKSLEVSQDQIQSVSDNETLEKLALSGKAKLDSNSAMKGIEEIDAECNLTEVIESMLKGRDLKYTGRQLVCNDRLRAAFVLEDKTIIDVIDQQFAHFVNKNGEKHLKLRGRLAEKLAKENGYSGYKLVSLVEMDYASDEQAFINEVLFGEKSRV